MQTPARIILTFLTGFFSSTILFPAQPAQAGGSPESTTGLAAPAAGEVQIITTRDGSTIIGKIVEVGENEIRFATELGELVIPVQSIRKVRAVPVSSIKNGQYWYPNPNATRLYFGPTARTLEKGECYFADYELFFPALTVGITNRLTIGGGMSIFPSVDLDEQLYYLTPKVGIKSFNNVHFAAGALLVKVPDESSVVGVLYSLGTFGTPDQSISMGLGYGFVGSELAEKPMVMIGGEKRFTRRLAFVSENWIFPGTDEPLVSYGLRFIGESLTVDLAFLNLLGEDAIFPGIPFIDLVFKF